MDWVKYSEYKAIMWDGMNKIGCERMRRNSPRNWECRAGSRSGREEVVVIVGE